MRRIVTDASALVEFLLRTELGRAAEAVITDPDTDLHVPSLCDVEVAAVVRRLSLSGRLETGRAREALSDYLDLPLRRHGHQRILTRLFELRENFSAYDASYLSLAESVGGALLTTDGPFGRAARRHGTVEVLSTSR